MERRDKFSWGLKIPPMVICLVKGANWRVSVELAGEKVT